MSESERIREILDELQAQVLDGYTQPVNGWTSVKQEAESAITQMLTEARLTEVPRYAPFNVAKYFGIKTTELNHSWYLPFCHDREDELKRELAALKEQDNLST